MAFDIKRHSTLLLLDERAVIEIQVAKIATFAYNRDGAVQEKENDHELDTHIF